jgi:hypothetical protein
MNTTGFLGKSLPLNSHSMHECLSKVVTEANQFAGQIFGTDMPLLVAEGIAKKVARRTPSAIVILKLRK